jgi:two-component system, NtrC family, sensor histidine kinase GlrK
VRVGPASLTSFVRLFTHLLVSHSAPVLVVTLALALTLTALIRISLVLTTLAESELHTLRDEGTLHRAAWSLDVAMRRGHVECMTTGSSEAAVQNILHGVQELGALLQGHPGGAMRTVAEGYVTVASEAIKSDVCERLTRPEIVAERARLDEQLTNVWVDHLHELHEAVGEKDNLARGIANSAVWTGVPLAIASFLLAMGVARRMARLINRPLATLSMMARRVGRGDFGSSVRVDGPAEIVALAEDLERMRIQLQELDALKRGFLASVSHELRTPLSKVREALALLEDGAVGELDGKQMRVVQIARASCEREIRLVTTLLDVSRLRAGSPLQRREGVSIDGVLHEAIRDETPDARSRGVEIDLELEGPSPTGLLDPALMERAIANLVRNAVFVSKKSDRVLVRRLFTPPREAGERGWARVVVVDSGPGIPEEILEVVLDPFVTRAVPGSTKASGVGLGLAMANEVAHAHGGRLDIVETGARGTTFEMWLPMDVQRPHEARDSGIIEPEGQRRQS